MAKIKGYTCSCCGTYHKELPTSYGNEAPVYYYEVEPEGRENRFMLDDDLCVMDDKHFFIRGCIEIREKQIRMQRFQCKVCKKKTSLTPKRDDSITYNQKRSDIHHLFAKLLVSCTPVTRTCEILEIGRGTYYDKLELLYRRCLEFLGRYETQSLQKLEFKGMWPNTDKMTYFLNNVRQKGMGGSRYDDVEETRFPTHVPVSADVLSRYVFRSDVAYDWDITLGDIALDTVLLKDDHLNEFAKKMLIIRIILTTRCHLR